MRSLTNIPDATVDRLLDGQEPADSRLEGVAEFLQDLRSAYPEESTTALEAAHLGAMLEAAQLLAEKHAPAEQSLESALAWQQWLARALSFRGLAAHKWAAAGALSVLGVMAFGGAAYAGLLPAPIQSAASAFVGQVGITIPAPHTRSQVTPGSLHRSGPANNGSAINSAGPGATTTVAPHLRAPGSVGVKKTDHGIVGGSAASRVPKAAAKSRHRAKTSKRSHPTKKPRARSKASNAGSIPKHPSPPKAGRRGSKQSGGQDGQKQ